MEPRHFYALGWAFVAAVCGVLAITMTWLFAVAAVACFAIGAAVERGWLGLRQGRVSWFSVSQRLPFELRSPIVRKRTDDPAPPHALGFLDFEARAVAEMTAMTKRLVAINRETRDIGKLMAKYTPRFANLWDKTAQFKQALAREVGSKIDDHVRRMDAHEADLRSRIAAMAENYLERLRFADAEPLADLRPKIVGMRDATGESRPAIVGMREATVGLRTISIQQSVNQATDRLDDVLGRLISDFDAVTRFTSDALRIIDDKIAEANVAAAEAAAVAAGEAAARKDAEKPPEDSGNTDG